MEEIRFVLRTFGDDILARKTNTWTTIIIIVVGSHSLRATLSHGVRTVHTIIIIIIINTYLLVDRIDSPAEHMCCSRVQQRSVEDPEKRL